MSATDELLRNAEAYAERFERGDLPMPPARRVAVVACMDARLNPYGILGLTEGEGHVIRNAGGVVTDDVIRSLAISQHLLGTEEIVLIHHTDCGMLTFTNDHLQAKLKEETGEDASGIDFLPFPDLEQSVRDDVERILSTPFIDSTIEVSGYIYDVHSGAVEQVVAPAAAGATA